MAIVGTGSALSFSDIKNELTGAPTASLLWFYNICFIAGDDGLMYHNVPNTNNTANVYGIGPSAAAAASLWDYYTTFGGYNTSIFYNYYQDPEPIMDIELINSSAWDIYFDFCLYDANPNLVYTYRSGILSPSATETYTNWGTNGNEFVSNLSGGYYLYIEKLYTTAPSILSANVSMSTPVCSDPDATGNAGTFGVGTMTRVGYVAPVNPFDDSSTDQTFCVCDADGNGLKIDSNRRTTISIEFV